MAKINKLLAVIIQQIAAECTPYEFMSLISDDKLRDKFNKISDNFQVMKHKS